MPTEPDPKKLHELASHPGTFPEMVQATYEAGREAGKREGEEDCEEQTTGLYRDKRLIGWTVSLLSAAILATLVLTHVLR